jgi:hypothetical protein
MKPRPRSSLHSLHCLRTFIIHRIHPALALAMSHEGHEQRSKTFVPLQTASFLKIHEHKALGVMKDCSSL